MDLRCVIQIQIQNTAAKMYTVFLLENKLPPCTDIVTHYFGGNFEEKRRKRKDRGKRMESKRMEYVCICKKGERKQKTRMASKYFLRIPAGAGGLLFLEIDRGGFIGFE
jgi:hypothetical protein